MMRGMEAGTMLPGGVMGLGCSTAAICVVLNELSSLNLSSITFSPTFVVLGIHEIMWVQ